MQDSFARIVGARHVAAGDDAAPWARDWSGRYEGAPAFVVRPGATAEVARCLALAHETGTPVTPVSGNTGLSGGAFAPGGVILSLDRMARIRDIRPGARTATAEAGVVLSRLDAAAEPHGLAFPMTFGARDSACIGGVLSTNAGGSNVLRHGNARDLCLGLEAVTAQGRVMDLLSGLHKDNSGFDLRHLLIGAEGQLGVITAATLRLAPRPRAHATATVAAAGLVQALELLNRLQDASGGAVEAFEYMPAAYIAEHLRLFPQARAPFGEIHETNVLVELAATAEADATPGPDGAIPVVARLEAALARGLEAGLVRDAVIARTEAQRREMWARREAAAEIAFARKPVVVHDIAVPLDRVQDFFDRVRPRVAALDPAATDLAVAHLGDGNIHYTVYPAGPGPCDAITGAVEDVVDELGGSFSAEHGIGLAKRAAMARRKDPVALDAMRAIKAALDPRGILNPGKTLPG